MGPKTVKNGKFQNWSRTFGWAKRTFSGHVGPVLTCVELLSAVLVHFSAASPVGLETVTESKRGPKPVQNDFFQTWPQTLWKGQTGVLIAIWRDTQLGPMGPPRSRERTCQASTGVAVRGHPQAPTPLCLLSIVLYCPIPYRPIPYPCPVSLFRLLSPRRYRTTSLSPWAHKHFAWHCAVAGSVFSGSSPKAPQQSGTFGLASAPR